MPDFEQILSINGSRCILIATGGMFETDVIVEVGDETPGGKLKIERQVFQGAYFWLCRVGWGPVLETIQGSPVNPGLPETLYQYLKVNS